jgi:hypothetical protein
MDEYAPKAQHEGWGSRLEREISRLSIGLKYEIVNTSFSPSPVRKDQSLRVSSSKTWF